MSLTKDKNEKPKKELWLWCDLETPGLETGSGPILEVAFRLYNPTEDLFLRIGPDRVGDTLITTLLKPNTVTYYKFMERGAFHMHTTTGLLKDLEENRKELPTSDEFFKEFTENLKQSIILFEEIHNCKVILKLAGASVHFDKKWLECYASELHRMLSYRIVDVSVMLSLVTALGYNPKDFKATTVEGTPHRAEYDLRCSIVTFGNIRAIFKDALELLDSRKF